MVPFSSDWAVYISTFIRGAFGEIKRVLGLSKDAADILKFCADTVLRVESRVPPVLQ